MLSRILSDVISNGAVREAALAGLIATTVTEPVFAGRKIDLASAANFSRCARRALVRR